MKKTILIGVILTLVFIFAPVIIVKIDKCPKPKKMQCRDTLVINSFYRINNAKLDYFFN